MVTKGGMLWALRNLSWLGWLFSVSRKLLEVKEAEQAIVDQQGSVDQCKIELIRKEEATKIIRTDLPKNLTGRTP